jgi:antitoxin component YwqK of YwqJK toxin-antitoxin module
MIPSKSAIDIINRNLKNYFQLVSLTVLLIPLSACQQHDNEGLQKMLKKSLSGPKRGAAVTPGGQRITPGAEDRKSLENSIESCPDDAKIAGQPYPRGKRQWCAYKDDSGAIIKHGEFRQWHSSGALHIQAWYEDDELHGEFTEFYPDSRIKEKSHFHHGKRHGKSISLNKEGQTIREATYADDFLNGPYVEYLRNGKPGKKGNYQADVKSGLWEEYDNKGTLQRKVEYKNDMKHGRVSEYNPQGKIRSQGFYEKDQQMGHWIHFDNNGMKQSEGNLVNGKRHGRWVEYDKQGSPRRTTYFNEGRKIDSFTHRGEHQNKPGGGKGGSFGSRDILGAEPPVRRNRTVVSPPVKKPTPETLRNDGWAPL